MTDLIKIGTDNLWNFTVIVSFWLWLPLIILGAVGTWLSFKQKTWFRRSFDIDAAEIGLGKSKITLKPSETDVQIAYKMWVELRTRKIGLPIDFEKDSLIEIYDSWYEFFKITRELIKEIPVSKIRVSNDTTSLVELAVRILNDGLRPHLTTWQSKFRHWFESNSTRKEFCNLSPQEFQKKFPEYAALKADMEIVNQHLIKYGENLHRLAFKK